MLTAVILELDTVVFDGDGLRDGARKAIEHCADQHLVIAGLTNMTEEQARQRLREAGLGELFGPIISTTATDGLDRGDPALFTLFCQRNGLKAEQCLLVGARSNQEGHARKIGITTAILSSGDADADEAFAPDHTIDGLTELPAIIDGRLGR